MKKAITILVAAALILSVFAGCSKKEESKQAASSAAATTVAQNTAPAKKSSSGDIKLAFIGNTTGDYAMYGVPVRNSVVMFFDQLNANGGINGKKVVLYEYDDKADGTEAVNAYNLAVDKGVTGVIGSVLTGATIALSDATYDDNMPQITASATSPKVTVMDPDSSVIEVKTNVFRTCFLDPFQGEKMAEYAGKVYNAKTVGIFYQNGSDYSEAIVAGFEKEAAKYGLKVVAKEAFAAGDVDYKAQMTNIASADPDVVLMPIYYGEAGLAITALRAMGCTSKIIGGDGFGSVYNYASAQDLEGTVYFSGYASGTESVAQFEKDYQATYGEPVPNMFAPLAWDASLLMSKALEAAENAGLETGSPEYKQKMIDAFKGMNAEPGITGSYTFNDTNDPVKSVAVIKLVNGKEVFDKFF